MSVFVCRKYVNALGTRLERFAPKGNDTWSFRCPLCGDSKKSKTKTRGHIYRKKNEFFFRCFNCAVSTTFDKFIKDVAPDLHTQFRFDKFLEMRGTPNKEPDVKAMLTQMKIDNERLNKGISLNGLSEDHKARKYVEGRLIPKESWKYISYTNDFKSVVAVLDPERSEGMPFGDERIVLSCLDKEDRLMSVSARAIDESNTLRYIHVKVAKGAPKIFGLDRLKKNDGYMFVFEGPIDSMFFENSLATCDADLAYARQFYDKLILVHDNQPRNRDIVRNVKRCIDAGFSVCLFPEGNPHKDVNDMVKAGMLVDDIKKEILDNTYDGMRATLKFNTWKKI
jgi:transcription elongation factor Elf1